VSIIEQYHAGQLKYEEAITQLTNLRSQELHRATSSRGANPLETAQLRTFAYKQADAYHQQLKQIWYERGYLTHPEFEKSINSHSPVIDGNTARYQTPTSLQPEPILHRRMSPDEVFAEQNEGYLALDLKMAQLEKIEQKVNMETWQKLS
jgi:hypothetical protein